MEGYIKEKLEEKAIVVSNYLHSVDILHTYRLLQYSINFSLHQGWKEHILSLSYSPNKGQWKLYSVDEWVKRVIIPLVQPLLGKVPHVTNKQEVKSTKNVRGVFSRAVHFAEALTCLGILEPFAEEYIDFSVICDFAQRGVQLVLNDPRCAHLDRTPLLKILEQPPQSNFCAAKEYLFQCLTICGVTES